MDQLRINKRIPTATLETEPNSHQIDNYEGESLEDGLQQLEQAMNTLPRQEAQILRMKYESGLDIREIGAQLSLKESAVKMRLKRSRDKVRLLCSDIYY